MTSWTPCYGNYGKFLSMGNAAFISSTIEDNSCWDVTALPHRTAAGRERSAATRIPAKNLIPTKENAIFSSVQQGPITDIIKHFQVLL